jgi:SAM-dependent methyltransferase
MRTQQDWAIAFAEAKHGHTLWDGLAVDPHHPSLAYTSAYKFVNHAEAFGFFKDGNTILDLGCGNGRFGIVFAERLVRYVGIDVVKECIEFCNKTFAPYNHLKFKHMDVWNEVFNPQGTMPPAAFKLPFVDECFDDLIAYSVFTHLQTKEVADRYMQEIWRVLKPGGKFFSTWYRSPPNAETTEVGRTCYKESDILSFIQGFTFDYTYGGNSNDYYNQWCLFGTKL